MLTDKFETLKELKDYIAANMGKTIIVTNCLYGVTHKRIIGESKPNGYFTKVVGGKMDGYDIFVTWPLKAYTEFTTNGYIEYENIYNSIKKFEFVFVEEDKDNGNNS